MARKPWESHEYTQINSPPPDLPGLLDFVDQILKVEYWREAKWSKQYPEHIDDIENACQSRRKALQYARSIVVGQLEQGTQDEQHGAWMLLLSGMVIQNAASFWQSHLADKLMDREDQLQTINDKRKANATTEQQWRIRQIEAELSLEEVREDLPHLDGKSQKKEACKRLMAYLSGSEDARESVNYHREKLGITAFNEWLNGKPQKRNR